MLNGNGAIHGDKVIYGNKSVRTNNAFGTKNKLNSNSLFNIKHKFQTTHLVVLMLVVFVSLQSYSAINFINVTSDDFENITKEMSANFTHNSLMGASKLGTVFGFQVGLVGAQTSSSKINDISLRAGGSEIKNLYQAGLLGAVGVPFGLSAELVVFPSATVSGASISSTSMALKWNINDVIPVLPVNLALRGIYSNSKFSFNQVISSVDSKIENKNSVTGLQLLFSPQLPIIEPYVGIGMLNGSNELSVSGQTSIFDSTYSTAQSEKKTASSTQTIIGAEVSLLLIKLGVEYSQAFGSSRYGFKLAAGF